MTTTTTITTRIRSSRDHGTRPLFMEKAATSQYSQNTPHPTAKTTSTALIPAHGSTHAARPGGRQCLVSGPDGSCAYGSRWSMDVPWELREAGPADAEHTVLLLPGGLCSAGSYAEVMADPALAGTRLVAVTLPGHAGAPPPDDYSVENYARLTSELATTVGADVVVGFSMGGSIALEMVASG